MRVTSLTLLLGAKIASAANSARVVLFDVPPRSPSSIEIVSPKIARFVFAQRLGLANDYSITGAEPAEVLQVDRYGGPQQYPLTGPKPSGSRLMIVVDGVEQADDIIPQDDRLTSFDIVPAPHPDDTKELMSELLNSPTSETSAFMAGDVNGLPELSEERGNTLKSHGDTIVMHVGSLEHVEQTNYNEEIARIRDVIHELRRDNSFQTVTIALMPPSHHCSKRSGATKTFGGLLRKRTSIRQTEVPLSSGPGPLAPSTPSRPVSQAEFEPFASKQSSIPWRYRTVDACEKTTRNCTGHGQCKSLGRDPSTDSTYYGCVCNKPEIRKDKAGGVKTTNFGGSACQKKDVVAPFWLLAGTTIFLLAVVSAGIGLLYSIGSEELPSVIGAGVSGPRAKQ